MSLWKYWFIPQRLLTMYVHKPTTVHLLKSLQLKILLLLLKQQALKLLNLYTKTVYINTKVLINHSRAAIIVFKALSKCIGIVCFCQRVVFKEQQTLTTGRGNTFKQKQMDMGPWV